MKKFVILGIALFSSYRCSLEDFCKNRELCDLAAEILDIAGAAIGQDLTVVTQIYNYASSNIDCGTETAPQSNSLYVLEKKVGNSFEPYKGIKPNSSDPSGALSEGVKITPSIEAGSFNSDLSFKFILRDPGTYRWVLASDYDLKIKERDEVNNVKEDGGTFGRYLSNNNNNIAYSNEFEIYDDPSIDVSNLPKFEIEFK
jgi:hypothetical protein